MMLSLKGKLAILESIQASGLAAGQPVTPLDLTQAGLIPEPPKGVWERDATAFVRGIVEDRQVQLWDKAWSGFKRHNERVTTKSSNPNRRTPRNFLKLVMGFACLSGSCGRFGLDPAPARDGWVEADAYCWLDEGIDGLQVGWRGYGPVWLNPPYGLTVLRKWLDKAVAEFSNVTWDDLTNPHLAQDELFLLIPGRPSSKWFQRVVLPHCSSVLFYKDRLHFDEMKDPAAFDSALVYFGRRMVEFHQYFAGYGWMPLTPREERLLAGVQLDHQDLRGQLIRRMRLDQVATERCMRELQAALAAGYSRPHDPGRPLVVESIEATLRVLTYPAGRRLVVNQPAFEATVEDLRAARLREVQEIRRRAA